MSTIILFLFVNELFGANLLLEVNHNEIGDSISIQNDSTDNSGSIDTPSLDTIPKKKETLAEPVLYNAEDSIAFNVDQKNVEMYKNAKVDYQGKVIEAALIEFSMYDQTVKASAYIDSTGKPIGLPQFSEKDDKFQAKYIAYNFKTQKGYIRSVKTEQEGGTLHGEYTKRQANEHIHIKEGKYSTCELDHPHFYIRLTKAMSIPNDKIVAGFSHLVVADIPLPLFLPFGFFPQTKTYKSGILIPNYGEERDRGFYLRDGGYYWAINQYTDATITGEVFSRGSWGVSPSLRYQKKYSFNGNFDGKYGVLKFGEIGSVDYRVDKSFFMNWRHSQDPKANPFQTFSASVSFSTANSNRYNGRSINERLTNDKSSSVSYQRRWAGSQANLSSRLNISQNTQSQKVTINFPETSFGSGRITPFKNKDSEGSDPKWYEKFETNYNASLSNNMQTSDSLLFKKNIFDKKQMDWRFSHSVPFSYPIKLASFINLTPSVNYNGYMFGFMINQQYNENYFDSISNKSGRREYDTVYQINYVQSFSPTASLGISPNFTGMYVFKNMRIKAIRHVIKPSASISYTPDMTKILKDYTEYLKNSDGSIYRDSTNKKNPTIKYSKYRISPPGSVERASIPMSLSNNLEMKYLKKTDTVDIEKKVVLLNNLNFSTNYDVFADSMNWSQISINASTSFFKNKLSINFGATLDPYSLNAAGLKTKYYELNENNRIGRLTNYNLQLSTSFNTTELKNKTTAIVPARNIFAYNGLPNLNPTIAPIMPMYADFDMSWSANISYGLYYSKPNHNKAEYNQTMNVSGDLSLSKKWKFGYQTGWDFKLNKLSTSSLNVMRDLHCWVMTFSWVPIGTYQSFNFQVNAKSSLLQDLKYTKNKFWYDNL